MSPRQKKIARKKSRDSSNRYNQRKKLQKIKEVEEHVIVEEKDDSDMNSDITDPLRMFSPQPPNCESIESPACLSPVSNSSAASDRLRRSVRRNIMKKNINPQHNLNEALTLRRESLTPSPQSSVIENDSATISQQVKFSNKTGRQDPVLTTPKKKSPWKYLLRKIKYRADKELQIKDRKIQELKRIMRNTKNN